MRRSAPAAVSRFRGEAASGRTSLGLLLSVLVAAAIGIGAAPASPSPAPVLEIRLHSIIHPIAAELVRDTLAEADRVHAAAVLIELDTPGGLAESTHEITTAMLAATTPVIVYVAPGGARAASAGFFLLMAADLAAMAPGTNAGAAHPVGGQGQTIEGKLGEKIEQDAAATIRALAARNGRDQALAEKAVIESRSFTADEAKRAGLIDCVANDRAALFAATQGRVLHKNGRQVELRLAGAPVEEIKPSAWRALLAVIAQPDIAYLLLTLGGLGLFFELMHPGAVLPGVLGAIFLVLAFFALSVLPVNGAGIVLIFLALVFFIAEIKVMSHGLLSLAGATCLVLGALMLFKSPEPALRVSLGWVGPVVAFALVVVLFMARLAARVFRLPVRTGQEGLLHAQGTARSPLAPHGKVFVHGELWDAESLQPIGAGDPVEVVGVRDLVLEVRPLRTAPVSGG
jgi:membrane-bound serine protease (ClpP class)